MRTIKNLLLALALTAMAVDAHAKDWVSYEGKSGPGKGKHIVFLSGDEEYRSEEALPALAKLLSQRHGFKCTVLFPVNPANGEIDPNFQKNIPGMEALDSADLCVMALRFRNLPEDQMTHFVKYFEAGKPIIALRTSTHAFQIDKSSPYAKYDWRSKEWPGGFGKQVLGETWVAHHGEHKKEATRGIIEPGKKAHPILRGVGDIFGDTDVYTANPPADAEILVLGQVLVGMNPSDKPVEGRKNEPMQPVVWLRSFKNDAGKTNKIVTTTMGSATDFKNEGMRRLLVNSCYWTLGLDVPPQANVEWTEKFDPTMYGFNGFKKGVKPSDHELK